MFYKIVVGATLIVLGFLGLHAQDSTPFPSTSSNFTDKVLAEMKLDVSTPDDAIKQFGKPDKDEVGGLSMRPKKALVDVTIKPMLSANEKPKAFHSLVFKKLGEMDGLTLSFYDGKLVQIILDYDMHQKEKLFLAGSLPERFKADFVILDTVAKGAKLSDFEGQKENTIPKVYEILYTLLSVQKDKVYFVRVENNSGKAFSRSIFKKPTKEMFPGLVSEMQIISRALEKK